MTLKNFAKRLGRGKNLKDHFELGIPRQKEPELCDERILGSGDFVERIMREAEARTQRLYAAANGRGRKAERLIADACKKHKVSITELRSGSRRGKIPEVARQVGVSTSAISKSLGRSYSS
jgi:REP-associated tyrosine transposase